VLTKKRKKTTNKGDNQKTNKKKKSANGIGTRFDAFSYNRPEELNEKAKGGASLSWRPQRNDGKL